MYKILLVLAILNHCLPFANAQHKKKQSFVKRYWNSLVNDTTPMTDPRLIVYPTAAYAPETSWEFGLSSLYVFYANRDTTNRLSEVNGFTFFTLENQYGIWFDHNIYGPKNNWFFFGRSRYQSFPILYHGIGPDSPSEHLAIVDANQLQLKERVLTRLYNNIYTGAEIDIQSMGNVRFENNAEQTFTRPLGSNGSTNVGLGAGILYDNRHNVLNVRDGFFSELAVLRYHPVIGSQNLFTTVLTDVRYFRPFRRTNVIAAQLIAQFNSGNIPFNQLAMLGGESMMRGYYLGRYRDEKLIATQIEYRMLPLPLKFTKRIGAAFFASTGTVINNYRNFDISNLAISGGAGLRLLLFPKKDIWTRVDFALTKEGSGLYIFIGEAF